MTFLPLKSTTHDQLVEDTDSSYLCYSAAWWYNVFSPLKGNAGQGEANRIYLICLFQDIVLHCLCINLVDLVSVEVWVERIQLSKIISLQFLGSVICSTFTFEWPSSILLDLQSWKESPSGKFSSMLGSTITNLRHISSRMEFDCHIE